MQTQFSPLLAAARIGRIFILSMLWLASVKLSQSQDVLTWHNDNARTGRDAKETILTPSNVNSASFGKLFTIPVDGKVDAQPLYVSAVAVVAQGIHNLLVVATEHDSLYAFDADSGSALWQISMLAAGETTSDARGCDQVTPEIGITATPVVVRPQGSNPVIYVVAMSKDQSGIYHHRLHAIDATDGAELYAGPKEIQATYPGNGDHSSGGNVIFDPGQYKERAGLLYLSGLIYTAWASHCDRRPYTGWVMAYSAANLEQKSVLNVVPNGSEGAMWNSGAGPAADGHGNIFVLDANGDFDTTLTSGGFPANGNYGNAFLKLSTRGGLKVSDYFETFNQQDENSNDVDLGSGGALLLPLAKDASGRVRHLAVGAGKDANLYVVDRDNMGKFNSSANNIYQELPGVLPGGIWSAPAFFNNRLYYGPVNHALLAFQFSLAKLSSSAVAQTGNSFGYPGVTPSVSGNGSHNGIVWAPENSNPAVLHAYDAITLQELYNSKQAAGERDNFGAGNKFITPTIANGKVYVGTTNGVGVFGLLH